MVFPDGWMARKSPWERGRSSDRTPDPAGSGLLPLSVPQLCEFGLQGV